MGKLNYTHEDDNIQSVNNQWIITSHYPDYKKFEKLFIDNERKFKLSFYDYFINYRGFLIMNYYYVL